MAEDWSARQYLKFEDERTRPPRDLLAQVPLIAPQRVIDLGCGPGNSTELLIERYPHARVVGLDSSPDMLRQARERLPRCTFEEADLAKWSPPAETDLLFGNAVFQWVPDHPAVFRRLLQTLPSGGVLAVQMPDNTTEPALMLMEEVASAGPWAATLATANAARNDLPSPRAYYDLLRPLLLAPRHLAHGLQPRDGRARGRRRMVQGLGAAAVPGSARGRDARATSSPPTRRRSRAPTRPASTARCCCGFRACSSWRCGRVGKIA